MPEQNVSVEVPNVGTSGQTEGKGPNDAFLTLIKSLVTEGRKAGVSVETVTSLISAVWAQPPAAVKDDAGDFWLEDGVSKPDEQGLVRIREIENIKAALIAAGRKGTADLILSKFCTTAALPHVVPGSIAHVSINTNTSTGMFLEGMGMYGGWFVYPCGPNPIANPKHPKYNPAASLFSIDRSKPIDDAYCIPFNVNTVKGVVDYIRSKFVDVVEYPDPGVGFGPNKKK